MLHSIIHLVDVSSESAVESLEFFLLVESHSLKFLTHGFCKGVNVGHGDSAGDGDAAGHADDFFSAVSASETAASGGTRGRAAPKGHNL